MDGIYRMAAGDVSPKDAQQVLERHVRSGHRDLDAVHSDIWSFIAEFLTTRSVPPLGNGSTTQTEERLAEGRDAGRHALFSQTSVEPDSLYVYQGIYYCILDVSFAPYHRTQGKRFSECVPPSGNS
jgi:hypothetical protein